LAGELPVIIENELLHRELLVAPTDDAIRLVQDNLSLWPYELSSVFLLHRDSVMAMNNSVWFGMAAVLAGPLQWFLRTRLLSMTLFREAFFWRLQRDLRKQRTIV